MLWFTRPDIANVYVPSAPEVTRQSGVAVVIRMQTFIAGVRSAFFTKPLTRTRIPEPVGVSVGVGVRVGVAVGVGVLVGATVGRGVDGRTVVVGFVGAIV